jgi:hypothetical protein
MKKNHHSLFILATLLSCSSNDVSTSTDYQENGNLPMTGRTANSETTGSNMEWQESYH